MANQEHLAILKQGKGVWNSWRTQHPQIHADLRRAKLMEADLTGAELRGADLTGADLSRADFSGADLSKADLSGADLSGADLSGATLRDANLSEANLSRATLSGANLWGAILSRASLWRANIGGAMLSKAILSEADLWGAILSGSDLSEADLSEADLSEADLSEANLWRANLSGINLYKADLWGANLWGANFSRANLSEADLTSAVLVGTNLTGTSLKDCRIYGISAWDVQLDRAEQLNLTITPHDQPTITVDNLKIAQFIYLLLNNVEIREVINTLTTKSVLILGRFTPERKDVLDALREALRTRNFLPILFDFDPAQTQTVRETVRTLAHLSHFVIADLTNSSSIPEELETIIPTLAIPIQPLLETTQKREFSMFKGYGIYPWVLPIYRYSNLEGLVNNIQEKVIEPATQKARELAEKKGHLNQEPFEQIF
jgi:uncharacterized protein YjbI with pentapeptide repeats